MISCFLALFLVYIIVDYTLHTIVTIVKSPFDELFVFSTITFVTLGFLVVLCVEVRREI